MPGLRSISGQRGTGPYGRSSRLIVPGLGKNSVGPYGLSGRRYGRIDEYEQMIVSTKGVVAYWHLEEIDGGMKASVGSHPDGVVTGSPVRGVSGLVANGRAFMCEGGSQYVSGTGIGLPIGANAPFSIEAWVQLPDTGNSGSLFGFSTGNTIRRGMLQYNGHLYFWGENQDFDTGAVIPSNEPAYCGFAFDGSTVLGYLNGVPVGSLARSLGAGTSEWYVGVREFGLSGSTVDEFAVYDRPLTADEWYQHYVMGWRFGRTRSTNFPHNTNVLRFPSSGTASYSAISAYDGNWVADNAADGTPPGSGAGNEWAINGAASGSWWQVDWTQPQSLVRVVLRDRPGAGEWFGNGSGAVTFSDGSTESFSTLADNGDPLTLEFSEKPGITWMRVTSVGAGSGNMGLWEVEAY